MPIQVQCCGLAVMFVLLFFYNRQKQVNLSTGKAYWRMFCMVFISLGLDILSCIAIVNMDNLPLWLVKIICKAYLVSFSAVAGFILQYIGAAILVSKKQYYHMIFIFSLVAVIGIFAIIVSPVNIFLDRKTNNLYTYGPSVWVTYIFSAVTTLVVLVWIIVNWKKLAKDRREAVLISIVLIIIAAAVQFFNNKLLVVGFAMTLCLAVLYLKLENPGYNIDNQTGLFNQNAFELYVTQLYNNKSDFAVIDILYDSSTLNTLREDSILNETLNYLETIPDNLVFKGSGNEILVLVEDGSRYQRELDILRKRFNEGWGITQDIIINPYWICVPNPYIVNNASDLSEIIRYVSLNNVELAETHFTVVEEVVAEKVNDDKKVNDLIISALNNDRVEVFYQPIYSTKEHRFTAAEALVRIRDDKGNIVPPYKFIPIAENNGMIFRLGEEVFRKVCHFISNNDLRKLGLKYIEVNLSVIQCAYENLADDFIKIMKKNNISPDMINFEITESASLDTKSVLLRNMQKLIDFGVKFSLDDFGTGQSNLNYIIDMPVDIVKFDREMTNAYFENSKAKYIMDAAMKMVKGMDLEIVSEGVETKEQLDTLEELQISFIQGFYFSKPLPAGEFLTFVSQNNTQ